MPFTPVINTLDSIGTTDKQELIREMQLLRDELDDIRTKYAAVLAKLDADAGVTDTNYGATAALAARRFTPT